MSLRARIALLVAVVVVAAAAASVTAVRVAAERRYRTLVHESDLVRAQALAPVLGALYLELGSWDGIQQLVSSLSDSGMRGMMGGRSGRMPQMARLALEAPGSRLVVVDDRGVVVVDSSESLLGTRSTAGGADGVPLRAGERPAGRLLVGTMVESVLAPQDTAFLGSITRAIVLAAAVAAFAAVVVGLIVADRITRPVRELTRAAERAAAGELGVRVDARAGGEIGRLAATFNTMSDSLREQEEGRRRMIADSAHELRTPASLIQGTVEAMLDGVYPADRATLEGLHQETVRLARLVEDLGELALLEAGRLALDRKPADLAELARTEVDRFAETARAAGVEMEVHTEPGARPVELDPARMGQVLANLLSNALRHTPTGGRIRITVAPDGPMHVSLRVDDTGPGIPDTDLEKVFERYYRVDDSRATRSGGRGLGLAIASGIVRAHGGTLRARRSTLGGACLVAVFPLRATRAHPGVHRV